MIQVSGGLQHLLDVPHHKPGTGIGADLMVLISFLRIAKVCNTLNQHTVLLQHVTCQIKTMQGDRGQVRVTISDTLNNPSTQARQSLQLTDGCPNV